MGASAMKLAIAALSVLSLASACKLGSFGSAPIVARRGDQGSQVTSITIGLPDRQGLKERVGDIEDKMNGFQLTVTPVDPACASATKVDEVGDYMTAKVVASLVQGCDYDVTLALGHRAVGSGPSPSPTASPTAAPTSSPSPSPTASPTSSPTAAPTASPTSSPTAAPTSSPTASPDSSLATAVTYKSQIKSLLDRACVRCHVPGFRGGDLTTYSAVRARGPKAAQDVASGRMPPEGTIPEADKALFKQWADGGYRETSAEPTPSPTPVPSTSLDKTYYKNNKPLRISKDDIQGKSELKASINLDLQPDGVALGL